MKGSFDHGQLVHVFLGEGHWSERGDTQEGVELNAGGLWRGILLTALQRAGHLRNAEDL